MMAEKVELFELREREVEENFLTRRHNSLECIAT